jgi:hypothetical protein
LVCVVDSERMCDVIGLVHDYNVWG